MGPWWGLLLAAGCVAPLPEGAEAWMRGATYRWLLFNHRISYVEMSMVDDAVDLAVVGGTSTTNQPIPPGPDDCREFPFVDRSEVAVGWGAITTDQVALGTGQAAFEAGAEGGTATIEVPLEGVSSGDTVSAVLRGYTLDTNRPLRGEPDRYLPEYGWHSRRIQLAILDVTLDGDVAIVEVGGAFDAGTTEDPDRVCIDEVRDRAVLSLGVDVLVVARHDGVEEQIITHDVAYPFSGDPLAPGPQAEVEPTALDLQQQGAIVGWSAIDFQFNPENENERGAYLRSFGFEIGPTGAAGIARNFSPGTQLHDMAYTFEGTVRAIRAEGDYATGQVRRTLEAALDLDGVPVVTRVPL